MTKKLLIIFLISVISFTIQAQNRVDAKGLKTGHWEKNYDNGKLRYQGQFEKGYEIDTFTYFFPSGEKKSIMVFSEKGKKAEFINYYKTGTVQSIGSYYEKKKDGIWKYFHQTDGYTVKQESYMKGAKDGVWKIYYPNKALAKEVNWQNGVKTGVWKEYYENEVLKISATYLSDKLVGGYVSYYMNKKVSRRGRYVEGKQDGKWITFEDDGSFKDVIIFNKGFIIKETRYENGKVVLERDKNNPKKEIKQDNESEEE